MVIPDSCVDPKTRRLLLTEIVLTEIENWLGPETARRQSIGWLIEKLLPNVVAFHTMRRTPEEWLCEHVQGVWIHWIDQVHFSHPDDAFAFRMRWT